MGLPAEDIRNDHLGSIARSLEIIAKHIAHPLMKVGSDGTQVAIKTPIIADSHSAAHIKK